MVSVMLSELVSVVVSEPAFEVTVGPTFEIVPVPAAVSDAEPGPPVGAARCARSTAARVATTAARVVVAAAVVAAVVATLVVRGDPAVAAWCWHPPVEGRVSDPFRAPPCRWCAGNRGIEYAVGVAVPVRAAATGRVTFSGVVAGRRYVVVSHASGWRHTYGGLSDSVVRRGDVVLAGSTIGRVTGAFHFGLRVGGTYRDPAPYLGVPATRPRLVPVDGSPARPAPASSVRCRVAPPGR